MNLTPPPLNTLVEDDSRLYGKKIINVAWQQWFQNLFTTITKPAVLMPIQAPTASAPAYVKGGIYFDTTLNKMRIGGAAGWETVTSV